MKETKEQKIQRILFKIEVLKNDNKTKGIKNRIFKSLFKSLVNNLFYGTDYKVVATKNMKERIGIYIRDTYTMRLFYIETICDLYQWNKEITYMTANEIYEIPKSYQNICCLDNLVYSIECLNVCYSKEINLIMTN